MARGCRLGGRFSRFPQSLGQVDGSSGEGVADGGVAVGDLSSPSPAGIYPEPYLACAAGDSGGGVQDHVPERGDLCSADAGVVLVGDELGPGKQVIGDHHHLQPRLVLCEAFGGESGRSQVACTAWSLTTVIGR